MEGPNIGLCGRLSQPKENLMKRIFFALFLVVAFATITAPASAQTISGVCLNDSHTCGGYYFNEWMSIYGSSLPNEPIPYVVVIVSSNSSSCGSGCLYINGSSIDQTYWYDSSSQINFNGYPAVPGASNLHNVYLQVYNESTLTYTNIVTLTYHS